jgi:endopolyphosphatase
MPGAYFSFDEKFTAEPLRGLFYCRNNRHDIDNGHPRTPAEIYESNRMVADRMEDIFLSRGVPVVPSLGDFLFYWVASFLTLHPQTI